jgi:predicted phage terminase large subunit-like protein
MAVRDLAKRSLQRGLARNYGHQTTIAALQARNKAAQLTAPADTYDKTFEEYIRDCYPQFPFTRHTRRLIALGQKVADGILRRVMVELPPRHWKSTIFSRFLPGYCLRRFPDRTVGMGCHTAKLAEDFSRTARDYFIKSGGAINPAKAGVQEWGTKGIGGLWAVGVGGGTGKPADFLIIDDPIKSREAAESAAWRRQIHSWWDSVLSTREEPGNAIVIVHTRWHDADLIGYLLTKMEELEKEGLGHLAETWHVVSLPIEAPPANDIKPFPLRCTIEPDDRQPGEALDPTRFDEDWIQRKRANTPERDWEAIYQQRPSAAAGAIFKSSTLRYWGTDPGDLRLPQHFVRVIASIDCTFKDSAGSDMVAFGLWGQTAQGMWLLDFINQQMDFPDTLDTIKLQHPAWKFGELLVEDKANGSAVISTLKREAQGYSLIEVNPFGGKVPRANAASVQFTQGRVFLPRNHPLIGVYVQQVLAFPSGTYDDLVDMTTQALNYVAGTGPMTVTEVSFGYGAPVQQFDMAELVGAGMGWPDTVLEDPDAYFPM